MDKKPLIGRKWLAVGIILLFLGAGIIPSTAQIFKKPFLSDLIETTELNAFPILDDVTWTINGTKGYNGWYISPVVLTCTYNHSVVAEVYYYYIGHNWTLYTEPFTISTQGGYDLQWYAVDHHGNHSPIGFILIKIDYTPPYVWKVIERIGLFRWRISVGAFDNVSGICKIEFYKNGALINIDTTPPFEFLFPGNIFKKRVIKIVAYDNAGLSGNTSTTSTVYSRAAMFGNRIIIHFPLD